MNFYRERDISDFFDVSIVLVTDNVQFNLAHNLKYMRRNGIEVILVVREYTDREEILSLLDSFPQLNWKVLVKGNTIGETIQDITEIASGQYLLFIDPFARMETDVVYQLRYIAEHYPNTFAITAENDHVVMVNKASLTPLHNIDLIRSWKHFWLKLPELLTISGKQMMIVPQAILNTGPENMDEGPKHRSGHAGDKRSLIFNWEFEKISKGPELMFSRFSHVTVPDYQAFDRKYRIIALVQIRNESHYLKDLFSHLEAYCDGVILLDDGSEDDSYNAANARNLLLKVSKEYKGYFNDLQNRNLLLELSYLFKCDWFFFIDADERFAGGANELFSFAARNDIDTITFRLVNLWDTEHQFRVNFPEGEAGILSRYRMFRNRGFMQISSKNELHFAATPFRRNVLYSSILIKHFGLMDATVRKNKYERYLRQDGAGLKQGYSYEYLIDGSEILRDVTEVMDPTLIDYSPRSVDSHVE